MREKWRDLPVRWTREDNLHFTLVFVGYVGDDQLAEICRISKKIARDYPSFELKFSRVIYGPPSARTAEGKPDSRTRMIWAEGERSETLAKLKCDLEDALLESGRSGFCRKEDRQFRPHLTLARMKEEWREFSPKPEINLKLKEAVSVESIEVMESELSPKGPTYTILESVSLKIEE